MLQHQGLTQGNWRDAGKEDPSVLESESPLYFGCAHIAKEGSDRGESKIPASGPILPMLFEIVEKGRNQGFIDIFQGESGWRPVQALLREC